MIPGGGNVRRGTSAKVAAAMKNSPVNPVFLAHFRQKKLQKKYVPYISYIEHISSTLQITTKAYLTSERRMLIIVQIGCTRQVRYLRYIRYIRLFTCLTAPPQHLRRCAACSSFHGRDEGVPGLESGHLAQRLHGVVMDIGIHGQVIPEMIDPEFIDPFIEILAVLLVDELGELVDRDAQFDRQVADAVAVPQERSVFPEMVFQGLSDGVGHGR